MPHVQITWVEGRTAEQKRKIAERVTAVLIEDGKAKRENIHVSFHDCPGDELRRGRRARGGSKTHALKAEGRLSQERRDSIQNRKGIPLVIEWR